MLQLLSLLLFFAQTSTADERAAFAALVEAPDVTITYAVLKAATTTAPQHCYVQGSISGRIRFHVQLPLPAKRTTSRGNLAFDKDGDGIPESLTKLQILQQSVLGKCDAKRRYQGQCDRKPSRL